MAGTEQLSPASRYHALRVRAVVDETLDAKSLVFEVPPELSDSFKYQPGQFLTLRLPVDGRHVPRCYSMSSAPGVDTAPRVTVKRVVQGRGSNWICDQLKAGDVVEVMAPAGVFTPRTLAGDFLLLAGGSGITPVFSILRAALVGGQCGQALYLGMEAGEVIALLDEQALKLRHLAIVGGLQGQHGVVGAGYPAVIAVEAGPGAAGGGLQGCMFGTHGGHHLGLACQFGGIVHRVGIQRRQRAAGALGDGAKVGGTLQHRRVVARPASGGLPALQAQAFHRGGITFVEGGVAAGVHPLVGQLMEDQPHGGRLTAGHQGVEQWVAADPVGPAQGAVSRHTVHTGLQPLRAQHASLGLGGLAVEIAAVAHTAHHRIAPGVQLQAERRRGHHVPHHRVAAQVGMAGVAGVVGQGQVGDGEAARLLGHLQTLLQGGRGAGIGQPVADGAGAAHQVHMAAHRLGVVAQAAATGAQTHGDQGRRHGAGRAQGGPTHRLPRLHEHQAGATSTRQS